MFLQPYNLAPELNDAMLRWLNHLAAQGILTTDAELRIVGWNRWLEQHSGLTAETVLGRPLFEVYPDLPGRGLDRPYQQALAGQVVVLAQRFHQFLLPMPPGIEGTTFTQMQQSVRIAPLTVDERIVGTISLIDDVTERVVREDELKQRIEELELLQASLHEVVREREALLSIASHELKTPLTGLLGHAHLVRRRVAETDSLPPRTLQSISAIITQAERLNRLVSSLLDVSSVQTGQLAIQRVPLDLCALVQRIVGEHSSTLSIHRLALSKPEEPLIAAGDEVRLTQVFTNLLSNAIKYSPHGGSITVKIVAHDEQAAVAIADPGIGIPSAELPNLFQRFFRVQSQSTRHVGGLGIGLYVVKEIVSQHGGTISVESTEGLGSTFTVHLPLCKSQPTGIPLDGLHAPDASLSTMDLPNAPDVVS
ncbi:MAG TPA: ATP-binding protein [Herpetosiphonaceae bacterium]